MAIRTGRGPLWLPYLQIAFSTQSVTTAARAVEYHVAQEADGTFLSAVVLVFQTGEAWSKFAVKDELAHYLVLPGARRIQASRFGESLQFLDHVCPLVVTGVH